MMVLKRSLALVILVSLLIGIVSFGSQMEHGNSGMAAAVPAKAKSKDYKYKSSTLKVKRGLAMDLMGLMMKKRSGISCPI